MSAPAKVPVCARRLEWLRQAEESVRHWRAGQWGPHSSLPPDLCPRCDERGKIFGGRCAACGWERGAPAPGAQAVG